MKMGKEIDSPHSPREPRIIWNSRSAPVPAPDLTVEKLQKDRDFVNKYILSQITSNPDNDSLVHVLFQSNGQSVVEMIREYRALGHLTEPQRRRRIEQTQQLENWEIVAGMLLYHNYQDLFDHHLEGRPVEEMPTVHPNDPIIRGLREQTSS